MLFFHIEAATLYMWCWENLRKNYDDISVYTIYFDIWIVSVNITWEKNYWHDKHVIVAYHHLV